MAARKMRASWDMKQDPDEFARKCTLLISKFRKIYGQIGSINDHNVSFQNVLFRLAECDREFTSASLELKFPQYVSAIEEIREASKNASKLLADFELETETRRPFYKKLFILKNKQFPLDPEFERFLEKLITSGKRNGFHLSQNVQDEIKSIRSNILLLSEEFKKNLEMDNTTLEFTEKELFGLPISFISNLNKTATGGRIVTLKPYHYFPIMKMAQNPVTRNRLGFAHDSQCASENTPIIEEIIKLRHKMATLLGYKSYSEFVVETCMVNSTETIETFLNDIIYKFQSNWKIESQHFLELKRKECSKQNIRYEGKLSYYDLLYYSYMVEQMHSSETFALVQDYLPFDIVKARIMEIFQSFLGLIFEKIKDAKVWHTEVEMYAVKDSVKNNLLGYFFLDLFPRQGKYKQTAMFELQPGSDKQVPVAALVGNFHRPASMSEPTLLGHSEMVTFFHEFGHVMHHICSQTKISYFSGINVEPDFVEAPAQTLENICWEKNFLIKISSHWETGEVLPDELIEVIIRSRYNNVAYKTLRQVVLCFFDHIVHAIMSKKAGEDSDIDVPPNTSFVFKQVSEKVLGLSPPEGTNVAAHFINLVTGNGADYFGYLWSASVSADMYYSKIRNKGFLNPEAGMDFRKNILALGRKKDAKDIVVEFLGRESNSEQFYKSKGLKIAET